ncbi:hypothetical protein D3C71_1789950 [compost metagenome]
MRAFLRDVAVRITRVLDDATECVDGSDQSSCLVVDAVLLLVFRVGRGRGGRHIGACGSRLLELIAGNTKSAGVVPCIFDRAKAKRRRSGRHARDGDTVAPIA